MSEKGIYVSPPETVNSRRKDLDLPILIKYLITYVIKEEGSKALNINKKIVELEHPITEKDIATWDKGGSILVSFSKFE